MVPDFKSRRKLLIKNVPLTFTMTLQVYPGILAQAIYMVFNDAFPESHRMFGPLFKEELVGYCWELTTGWC